MANRRKEKNISVFNRDVISTGNYAYTTNTLFSAKIATQRQSKEILSLLKQFFSKDVSILDVGCGDGIFTLEIFNKIKPKSIVGFDIAKQAVLRARKRITNSSTKKITFVECSIYDTKKRFSKQNFSVGIVRGVLHHLYRPVTAVSALNFLPAIIVLEPNGFNPILKIIEKISPYHRAHEEKSYFPPTLNRWFEKNGYYVASQKFVGIVPYFFPEFLARLLKQIEPLFEGIPFLQIFYTGTNVILYKKAIH